jgi:hypothetical protein
MRLFSCVGMLFLLAACGGTADPPDSAPVVAVVVTPSEGPPLRGGESFQFSAEAQDEDGNPLPRPITWSMGSPDLATVSQTGLVTILPGTGHGSGSLIVVAATEGKQGHASIPIHDWSFEESGDFSGSLLRVAGMDAETGPTSLYVRCQADLPEFRAPPFQTSLGPARLEVYVAGEALPEGGTVRYQFDQQAVHEEVWAPSNNPASLFYPLDTRSFAEAIVAADTLRFEYWDLAGSIISSTFAVRGLEHYIDRVFENCLGAIQKVSGDEQSGAKGFELANPLVVLVRGETGNPLPGQTVSWIMGGAHSGSVSSAITTTDSEGHASVSWTIGSADVSSVQAVSAFGIATFTAQGF